MPYSNNLYSANDESDAESFSDELSPTDGFFNPNRMAPNTMVPDPSLDVCTTEDKVLISSHEARTDSGRASRSTNSPSLGQLFPSQNYASSQSNNQPSSSNPPPVPVSYRRTDRFFSEHTPSVRDPPPPAYTPSSPTSSDASHILRGYSTFKPHQLEQGFPQSPEPQSMSISVDPPPHEETPLSNSPVRRTSRRRLVIQRLLFVALVMAVAVGTMTTLLNFGKSIKTNPHSPDKPQTPNNPVGKPIPDQPDGKNPPSLGLPSDSSGPYCSFAIYHSGEVYFDFALDAGIKVIQKTHNGDNSDKKSPHSGVSTSGEIKLRKLPKGSKYGERGVVSMDVNVSDANLQVIKLWDTETRTMTVSTPRSAGFAPGHRETHCISLEITVWLPEDAQVSGLFLISETLSIRVFDDIKVKVSSDSTFSSVSGDISFPEIGKNDPIPTETYPFDSRHIVVETISGNIKGIYPLYDSLKFITKSGDIKTGVFPQPGLPSAPESADLEITTASGNIEVNLPRQIPGYTPPPRDYITRVTSASGNIDGGYFLGSIGNFKTTSGNVKMEILPIIQVSGSTNPDDAPKTQFETWTVSGSQTVEILDPVFIPLLPSKQSDHHISPVPHIPFSDDDPYLLPPHLRQDATLQERSIARTWRTLEATHHSASENVLVQYPDAWEGTVSAKTISGKIVTEGKGLKIITYKNGWAYKEVVSGKGASKVGEGSTVTMNTISGGLKFGVGEKK